MQSANVLGCSGGLLRIQDLKQFMEMATPKLPFCKLKIGYIQSDVDPFGSRWMQVYKDRAASSWIELQWQLKYENEGAGIATKHSTTT